MDEPVITSVAPAPGTTGGSHPPWDPSSPDPPPRDGPAKICAPAAVRAGQREVPMLRCSDCGHVRQFAGYAAIVCTRCGGRVLEQLPPAQQKPRMLRAI